MSNGLIGSFCTCGPAILPLAGLLSARLYFLPMSTSLVLLSVSTSRLKSPLYSYLSLEIASSLLLRAYWNLCMVFE